MVITPDSPLVGKDSNSSLTTDLELDIIEIKDRKGITWLPDDYEILEANDVLIVRGSIDDIMLLKTFGYSVQQIFRTGR